MGGGDPPFPLCCQSHRALSFHCSIKRPRVTSHDSPTYGSLLANIVPWWAGFITVVHAVYNVPFARVHDAGQIDASGGQIMRSPNACRMHRRTVFRSNQFCFDWLEIDYPCNLLNDSCHFLDTSTLARRCRSGSSAFPPFLFLPTAHPPQLEKGSVHFI